MMNIWCNCMITHSTVMSAASRTPWTFRENVLVTFWINSDSWYSACRTHAPVDAHAPSPLSLFPDRSLEIPHRSIDWSPWRELTGWDLGYLIITYALPTRRLVRWIKLFSRFHSFVACRRLLSYHERKKNLRQIFRDERKFSLTSDTCSISTQTNGSLNQDRFRLFRPYDIWLLRLWKPLTLRSER